MVVIQSTRDACEAANALARPHVLVAVTVIFFSPGPGLGLGGPGPGGWP